MRSDVKRCKCNDIKPGDMVAICNDCNGAKRASIDHRGAYKQGVKDER